MKVTCKTCKKEFNKLSSQMKRSKSGFHFCSRSCSQSYNNRKNPKRLKTNKCKKCSSLIYSGKVYCTECYTFFCDDSEVSINDLRCTENYQKSSKIRSRARTIYKNSDKPKICSICGYDKHVHIAHIKAISSFPKSSKMKEVNALSNLVALCPNHHWEFDHGLLTLDLLS